MTAASTTFQGFPEEGLRFLEDLRRNNTQPWFDAHRQEYEQHVLEPSRAFVVAMGERLRSIAPGIHFEPRVNGSLFRVNRDTRFSKDKSPYKTNIGIVFWQGGKRMESPGFYFHLQPGTLLLAAGMHLFPRELLEPFRNAVVDPSSGAALRRVVDEIEAFTGRNVFTPPGCGFDIEHYKKVPKGFDADHDNADLLRLKGLSASQELPCPAEVHGPELVDLCFDRYQGMAPVHHWLVQTLFP